MGESRYLKEVQRLFLGSFKDVLRKFQGCLKKVPSVFQENFIKSFRDVSKIFKWRRFFCNFIAWISSQLPEHKEGLFIQHCTVELITVSVWLIVYFPIPELRNIMTKNQHFQTKNTQQKVLMNSWQIVCGFHDFLNNYLCMFRSLKS